MRVPTGGRTCRVIWPVSTVGKEIGSQERQQQERDRDGGQEAGHEQAAMIDRQGQKVAVALADRLEAASKRRCKRAKMWRPWAWCMA